MPLENNHCKPLCTPISKRTTSSPASMGFLTSFCPLTIRKTNSKVNTFTSMTCQTSLQQSNECHATTHEKSNDPLNPLAFNTEKQTASTTTLTSLVASTSTPSIDSNSTLPHSSSFPNDLTTLPTKKGTRSRSRSKKKSTSIALFMDSDLNDLMSPRKKLKKKKPVTPPSSSLLSLGTPKDIPMDIPMIQTPLLYLQFLQYKKKFPILFDENIDLDLELATRHNAFELSKVDDVHPTEPTKPTPSTKLNLTTWKPNHRHLKVQFSSHVHIVHYSKDLTVPLDPSKEKQLPMRVCPRIPAKWYAKSLIFMPLRRLTFARPEQGIVQTKKDASNEQELSSTFFTPPPPPSSSSSSSSSSMCISTPPSFAIQDSKVSIDLIKESSIPCTISTTHPTSLPSSSSFSSLPSLLSLPCPSVPSTETKPFILSSNHNDLSVPSLSYESEPTIQTSSSFLSRFIRWKGRHLGKGILNVLQSIRSFTQVSPLHPMPVLCPFASAPFSHLH